MISDVLSEAVKKIEDYQKMIPEAYDEVRDEIDTVTGIMTALRVFFDTPPTEPNDEKLKTAFWKRLAELANRRTA